MIHGTNKPNDTTVKTSFKDQAAEGFKSVAKTVGKTFPTAGGTKGTGQQLKLAASIVGWTAVSVLSGGAIPLGLSIGTVLGKILNSTTQVKPESEALKNLKCEVKNITKTPEKLYIKAKKINEKYSISIGDPTKGLTQLDEGGAGTIFLNPLKNKVFKKFHNKSLDTEGKENRDKTRKALVKSANKETQFSINIHAKIKKLGLSSAGMPPKAQIIYGLNGEMKGIKQTAFSEGGLHLYMNNKLAKMENMQENGGKAIKFDITSQLLEGLLTFDKIDFVHLDIKPANILIDVNNGVVLAGFGDLGSAVDFSQANIGKILNQIQGVQFTDSHVLQKDKDKFYELQDELKKMYKSNPKDPALLEKIGEIKQLAKNMAIYATGLSLAQLYYTQPSTINVGIDENDEPIKKIDWLGFRDPKNNKRSPTDNTLTEFLEEDSNKPDAEQKCPPAIRDLIAKMTDPTKRSTLTQESITRAREAVARTQL